MIHLTNINKLIKEVSKEVEKSANYRKIENIDDSIVMQEKYTQNLILLNALTEALEIISKRDCNMVQEIICYRNK